MLNIFRRRQATAPKGRLRELNAQGVVVRLEGEGEPLDEVASKGFLEQLLDDGHASLSNEEIVLSWSNLFDALSSPGYEGLVQALKLPPETSLAPRLSSAGSLADANFSIAVGDWSKRDGKSRDVTILGALLLVDGQQERMTEAQWRMFTEVVRFSRRAESERNDLTHRQAWGRIRALARAADARLDDFLVRTVVLTPDKLEIGLRKSATVSDDSVIEIEPTFEGAPASWLERFDSAREVLDRYDIVTPEGIVQVLIAPAVKTVLKEVKRLEARRVAGSRAQAFVLNPFAALGDAATEVIDERQFEQARESAGLTYERFTPVVDRDGTGYPVRVGLLIEGAGSDGPTASENRWLSDDELKQFVQRLERALGRGFQLLAWEGYDFELLGDTPGHLELLQMALAARSRPSTLISYVDIHDLSAYSTRIEGIGVEKPYYSAYIARKKESDDEGFFPSNVIPVIGFTPDGETEPVAVPATDDALEALRQAADKARADGQESVSVSWLPKPMPLREADSILGTFSNALKDVREGRFDPEKAARKPSGAEQTGKRKTLVLRANIQKLDYEEARREALAALPAEPEIPRSLLPGMSLLPHQREGLAWLQHLFKSRKEHEVRGAVLADDMGLGKTFQLLSLMSWLLEREPGIAPMLVVAPVSLLENWREEVDKFFVKGSLPVLTAYGSSLAALRVPREAVEERLRKEDGLVRFLKPDWLGGAKVVLTTYETLRDLEFSFALQKWSVMVCDEAQRIKNPAAMVTRAAKKQNVEFRIACTGTPVENTLADLWCLFDFIQPGLLGALDDFGRRYRKPIEAKTDEEKARVDELRKRIAPQILRRTKADVAKNLPKKVVVEGCRQLPISVVQRNLYASAIEDFKKRNDPGTTSPFKNHLGLLHYLRLVCTDPKRHGLTVFKPEPLGEYRAKAPKLDWLLKTLKDIKEANEKVIVFCEFRNIQRLLQHYIEEVFGERPDIINGDTSAAAENSASRQKRIKAFQSKPGFGVIILSPVAVGFGVNIQAANHVVHYTRTWNPAKEDQATDRAYRIGQMKDVYVYYPVVRAEDFHTFDVKLDQLLAYKRELAGDMLNGSGDIAPSDFNLADVVPEGQRRELDERVDLATALRMEWRHFEAMSTLLWQKRGFDHAYCTPPTNDKGVDVVAILGDKGVLIQTKTSATDGTRLNWETVKDVVTGAAFYRERHPHVSFELIGLTNQFFNKTAHEEAARNGVRLIEQDGLGSLLAETPVTMVEIERVLYSDWDLPDTQSP